MINIIYLILCILCSIYSFNLGRVKERNRIEGLIKETFNTRISSTVWWLWKSVHSGEKHLTDKDNG